MSNPFWGAGLSPQFPPTVSAATKSGGLRSGDAIIAAVAGLVVLGLLALCLFWVWKKKSGNAASHNSDDLELAWTGQLSPRVFTFDVLFQATNGFSEDNRLGEGGFGCVYRGVLPHPDGRQVAVKKQNPAGGQGEREFKVEVETLCGARHKHLVKLLGYCISNNERLLVYEYIPNNTLRHHLNGEGRPVMDWSNRVKAALGAARAIAYLHKDCHVPILHRDIKSSNILVRANFEVVVADFGLAKLVTVSNTPPVLNSCGGTPGYMAPEYFSNFELTEKYDVYAFGVVLLELITGHKAVIGSQSLTEWARRSLTGAIQHGQFGGLVDPRLGNGYVVAQMIKMIEIAAKCIQNSAAQRPQMNEVVDALNSLAQLSDLRACFGEKLAESSAKIILISPYEIGSNMICIGCSFLEL